MKPPLAVHEVELVFAKLWSLRILPQQFDCRNTGLARLTQNIYTVNVIGDGCVRVTGAFIADTRQIFFGDCGIWQGSGWLFPAHKQSKLAHAKLWMNLQIKKKIS